MTAQLSSLLSRFVLRPNSVDRYGDMQHSFTKGSNDYLSECRRVSARGYIQSGIQFVSRLCKMCLSSSPILTYRVNKTCTRTAINERIRVRTSIHPGLSCLHR